MFIISTVAAYFLSTWELGNENCLFCNASVLTSDNNLSFPLDKNRVS